MTLYDRRDYFAAARAEEDRQMAATLQSIDQWLPLLWEAKDLDLYNVDGTRRVQQAEILQRIRSDVGVLRLAYFRARR